MESNGDEVSAEQDDNFVATAAMKISSDELPAVGSTAEAIEDGTRSSAADDSAEDEANIRGAVAGGESEDESRDVADNDRAVSADEEQLDSPSSGGVR